MIVVLLAAALAATPDPVVHTLRWEPVRDRVDDRGTLADGRQVRVVALSDDALLRGQCKSAPYRRALTAAGLVEGPYSWPVAEESGWVFPPGPAGVREWLVEPADCPLYTLESRTTSAGLARLEHRSDDLRAAVGRAAPFAPEDAAWLAAGDPAQWRARYATLRPPGPHPGFALRPRPEPGARQVALDPFNRRDGDRWWRVDDARWQVRGPRRVRVVARWRGEPHLLCLRVDEATSCQDRSVWEETVVLDGALEPRSGHAGGELVSRMAQWSALLPPGTHELALPGPALVRTWAEPTHLYDGPFRPADVPLVVPATAPGPDERNTLPPDGDREAMLLYGPSIAPVRPDGIRWVPTDELGSGKRHDSPGEALVLVTAPDLSGDTCTLAFGPSDRWTAADPVGTWRFVWSGRSEAVAAPVGEGCVARVRVSGLQGAVPGAWVAGRWWISRAGEVTTFHAEGVDPVLWLSHPADRTEPYRVRVEHSGGVNTALVVEPRAVAPSRWSPEGDGWHAALAVPLPQPGPVRVSVDADIAVKVTAGVPAAPGPGTTLQGAPGDLRALSRAIAAAPDGHTRAGALLSRAGALWANGALGPAWQDWERADALAPAAVDDNPITLPLRRQVARLAHGPDRWSPTDPRWVPADRPGDLALAAARGDFLAVAQSLAATDDDPRRWWREGLAAGQIPTADQRMAAYRDLVARSQPAEWDAAWWWPIRAASHWERVHQVSGVRSAQPPWPAEPPGVDLFPDAWPAGEITDLGAGWEVQLPAGPARSVPVRCRGTRVVPEAQTCRYRALALDGTVLAETVVDLWGTPGTLDIPATDRAVHIAVRPDDGVEAQVRVPPRESVTRDALSLPAGGNARFTVLGPTVVRVAVLAQSPATVRVFGVPFAVDGAADLQVNIDRQGPTTVTVTADAALYLVPWVRVPATGSGPVPSDVAHLAATRGDGRQHEPWSWSASPRPPWVPPTGRPPADKPVTVVSRTAVGNADVFDEQPEDQTGLGLRVVQDVAVAGRFRLPIWVESHVRAEGSPGGGMLSYGALGEAVPIHRRWRLRVLASGEYVSSVGNDWPFSSLHLLVRLAADAPLGGPWRGSVGLDGIQRIAFEAFDTEVWTPDLTRLWSPYKEDHRRALTPSAVLRFEPGPWSLAALRVETTTNDTPAGGLDSVATEARVDLARPSLWLRLGGRLDMRLPDEDRPAAYLSPELFGTAAVSAWPERDLGLQLRISGRYRSHWQEATGLVELRLYASSDRALSDIRPSALVMPHAHAWAQDLAAERRRTRAEEDE